MNKHQRAELAAIASILRGKSEDDLANMSMADREIFVLNLAGVITDIRDMVDQEQEKFENMPEGLQSGAKGDDITNAIDVLESVIGELETIEPDYPIEDWGTETYDLLQTQADELEGV